MNKQINNINYKYKLSIYYKNGMMFKFSPFGNGNKNYSDKREVKKE